MDYNPESDVRDNVDFDDESDPGSDEDYTPIKKYSYNNKKLPKKGNNFIFTLI